MVTHSRAASGAGRAGVGPSLPVSPQHHPSPAHGRGARGEGKLRPLNQPRPINVEADANDTPLNVEHHAVEAILEKWRIEDEWWRAQPVSRTYWRLLLEDGRIVDVYRDGVREAWYRQAYSR